MSKYKIQVIETEANNFDKAYMIIKSKMPFDLKSKQTAHKYIQGLLAKTHAVKLITLGGRKCCPTCNGVQNNIFNGNKYYCPYCGQKVQDVVEEENNAK